MPYLYNTPDDRSAMLAAIGASSVEELFTLIPPEMRFQGLLNLPPALTEPELTRVVQQLAGKNEHLGSKVCFLGGGAYDHFIPAAIDALASRGEFYTSYTPYQPEVSQGNVQAMFEYQSLVCELTGLDVSNASLYDGGSAAVEAVLLAMSVTRRPGKVVTLRSVHPEYRQVIQTTFASLGAELVEVTASPSGAVAVDEVARVVDDQTACILVQSPNFFGCVEDVASLASLAHQHGALLVQAFDPISLGLLKRPGDLGADVAIAEGQSLGNPLLYGGPYLGMMACREQFVRRLPGRIAGQTVDRRGRRCWVLTLQTREQHIRREKSTSNICSNQTLFALRAAIYLALCGPRGLQEVASLCTRKAHYASTQLSRGERFQLPFAAPFFKEFVLRDTAQQVPELLAAALEAGYLAGIPLGTWYPELDDCLLVSVTEKRTRAEIEGLANALQTASVEEVQHA